LLEIVNFRPVTPNVPTVLHSIAGDCKLQACNTLCANYTS